MTVAVRTSALFIGCAVALTCSVADAKCSFASLASSRAGALVRFDDPRLPWIAQISALSGMVKVEHRATGTMCIIMTDSDATPQVYGSKAAIGIRVVEISSDDLVFYDARTCEPLEHPRPLHLGVRSQPEKERLLSKMGLCVGR